MLGGPAAGGFAAEVVGPDQLVEEAVPPEQCVERDLGVVRFAVVQVQIEGAALIQ